GVPPSAARCARSEPPSHLRVPRARGARRSNLCEARGAGVHGRAPKCPGQIARAESPGNLLEFRGDRLGTRLALPRIAAPAAGVDGEKVKTMESKNMKVAYAITERAGKSYWTRIGVALVNRDGSWNVKLDAIPVGQATLQLRDWEPRDEQQPHDDFAMGAR